MTQVDLFDKLPDEQSARQRLEDICWSDGKRRCPFCAGTRTYHVENEQSLPYRCRDCRKYFSVRTDMVMERSKVPLRKRVIAIYLFSSARKGMSGIALQKALGVTPKTAWYMNQRIREGWDRGTAPLGGPVENDELYVGGKEKNRHGKKKPRAGRGSVGKGPVVGVQQQGGAVFALPVADVKRESLTEFVLGTVAKGATDYTDEHSGCTELGRLYNIIPREGYHGHWTALDYREVAARASGQEQAQAD